MKGKPRTSEDLDRACSLLASGDAENITAGCDTLVRAFHHDLLGYASSLTGDGAAAADLCQDFWERLLARAADGTLPPIRPTTAGAYFRRAIRNAFLDLARKDHRTSMVALPDDLEAAERPPGGLTPEQRADVWSAVEGALPLSLVPILALKLEGVTRRAACAQLGITPQAWDKRLSRLYLVLAEERRRLRSLLDDLVDP